MIFLTFFLGLIANFIGYIPPGNINLTLVKIAINRGLKQALQFIIAFSCVEFFFTYFIMNAAKWLSAQVNLGTIIDWVMVVLFTVLGVVTWLHRKKPAETKYSEHDSIKYGILLGFLNPMQVPFWMITGTYLITHQWIVDGGLDLVIFSIGSAGGAFLCLFLYAKFAEYIQSKFELSNKVINTGIAILFFAFAGYHIVKRVYVDVLEKVHRSATVNTNEEKEQLLIGEWDMCKLAHSTKIHLNGKDSLIWSGTSFNICPKIAFNPHHQGFIKYPGGQIGNFTWKIDVNKLSFKNKKDPNLINNGLYDMTYTKKPKYLELNLSDAQKTTIYILGK